MKLRLVIFNLLRGFEKIPGVRLYQVAHFTSFSIILVPKVATRSTRDALLRHHYPQIADTIKLTSQKNQFASNHITYHSFSSLSQLASKRRLVIFYRNHHERIRSCWRQKVKTESGVFYFWMYYPFLRRGMSESEFVKMTSCLEPYFSEKHFENYGRIYDISGVDTRDLKDFDSFFAHELGFTIKSNVTS